MSFTQLISLFEGSQIMTFIAYFFIFNISLIFIETLIDLMTSKKRRWKDTGANFMIFMINQLLEKTIVGSIGLLCLMPFHWLTPLSIPMNLLTWVLAFFVADLTYYWMHRIEHEHRILWALHSVHHSSKDYNLSVSFRLSIIEGLIEWVFLIPMILIGFSPFQAIVGLILVAQFQTWIHTERIGKLGWLDKIFNTPSVHRVHHGSNRKYLDKNYGGFLIIWDRIFGTYQKEEEQVIYGLTKDINTNNPLLINIVEFKSIIKDLKRCKSWKDRFKIIFGNLSWRPDYFKKESNNIG
ncbi:sterol desaturase family protein [Winogradskyella sp. UBA3174]|uniref:sterol desaturase family protein n=1 Tax=Winogradskyella sp. UBA3174 TaxID=1947785 RepID=UPI002601357B|nr:sterol desaturase family protein [Winogradskyella sp. UBA3174]|tara:strand:- start:10631 stop:11515 length:885 start_codon:yes stop_codon:yes gene_type:complete